MITCPMQVSNTEYSIFVVLDDEGVDRIKHYDPAEVNIRKILLGSVVSGFADLALKDVVIMYGTQEEIDRLIASDTKEKVYAAIKALSRGFEFRPEGGDNDAPYLSYRTKPGEKAH